MQYICLHKETALHNALRYNFALPGPARFSEPEDENSLLSMHFLRKVCNRLKLWVGSCPPVKTPLAAMLY